MPRTSGKSFSSIWLSLWTSVYNDFQPQGRYLFPALIPIMIGLINGIRHFSRIINASEKIFTGLLAGLMTILWIFSFLMLLFYYEIRRADSMVQNIFFYYEKMAFILHSDSLRALMLIGGFITIVLIIAFIWKNTLKHFNVS